MIENHPPKTETVFRTVSRDNGEGEAYREAIRRIGGLHEEVVPILNQLEAAKQQIFHGHNVEERNKKHHESRPGMWDDPIDQ